MRRARGCPSLAGLGRDIKAARRALGMSRRDLAETVGIDPRYLANIENSGSLPSLPIFHELVRICRLPVEQYFFDIQDGQSSELRRRVSHKLALCDDGLLPVIEGALDGALRVQESEWGTGG